MLKAPGARQACRHRQRPDIVEVMHHHSLYWDPSVPSGSPVQPRSERDPYGMLWEKGSHWP